MKWYSKLTAYFHRKERPRSASKKTADELSRCYECKTKLEDPRSLLCNSCFEREQKQWEKENIKDEIPEPFDIVSHDYQEYVRAITPEEGW